MNQHEQERFDGLYSKHLQALKLQGKREKTIDGYARALRRIAGYFDCCPDSLEPDQLKTYFAWMVENYSWSSVKVDLWGLSFFTAMSLAARWNGLRLSIRQRPDLYPMFQPERKCND